MVGSKCWYKSLSKIVKINKKETKGLEDLIEESMFGRSYKM